MNQRRVRILLGFMIAPLVPALIAYLCNLVSGHQGEGRWVAALFLAFGYLVTAIFGIPTYLVFLGRRSAGLLTYLAAGAVIGAVAVILVFMPDLWANWNSNREHALGLLRNGIPILGGVSGAIGAGVFWLVAVRAYRGTEAAT